MMARCLVLFTVALLAASLAGSARAEIFVVSNSGTSLDSDEIFDVFLGGKQFSGDTKLVPVDNAAAHEEFLAKVLRMSHSRYTALWIRKSFRDGTRQPPVKAGDTETIEFVRKTPGAVGYVRVLPKGLKVIRSY
ncbi:ABC-type phosphate transport system, periplasmic component [Geobacter metallireducens RCH3]|uniref:Phosphate ABC transporter substrate-binding protein n=1 Tax=Geobacter metallireducens (strain ATCC 53774 / DSM 7210 / GS-15) TaxID=269799 RepID=Q39RB2_GEOMG|nr:hypothetical protein [Geobacter metallireducens]ABB33212.1 hypothetical protein Gmet_2997 [Geobacter metallireducens GS-15]EHP84425.1 ABC-type phosphate transport system, periplasmic component [Geobacter metallireducens RCH3]